MPSQMQMPSSPIASSPRKRKALTNPESSHKQIRTSDTLPLQSVCDDEEVLTDACPPDGKGRSVLSTVFSPVFAFFAHESDENKDSCLPSTSEPSATHSVDTLENAALCIETALDEAAMEDEAGGQTENDDLHDSVHSDDLLSDLEAALLFIKRLPPLETCAPKHRPSLLPRQTRSTARKTLVLDLDETLVHSCLEEVPNSDFVFPVTYESQELKVHVRMRPHLQTFMQRVSELFEVVIFTASQKVYAEQVLNSLDPQRQFFRHRVYRDSCLYVDGNYLKDLSVLGRDLRNTIIIDNSPQAFGFQLENGIPIVSWYDDGNDRQLLGLLPFLEGLAHVDDVRPAIQTRYRLQQIMANIDESRFDLEL